MNDTQILKQQPDLSKLSKLKPQILSPSVEAKNNSPSANLKMATNKKNYVTVRKFNSALATVGSNKAEPKKQFIQQAALSNLPEKFSFIPSTPKNRNRRIPNQSKSFDSKQIDSTEINDSDTSNSKLTVNDTDSSENYSQICEDFSDDSRINNRSSENLLKNTVCSRKRKVINCSSSFILPQQKDIPRINSSFSFIELQKKVSKSSSQNSNESLSSSMQSFREIKSVSSRLSLIENKFTDQKITLQFLSNWGHPKCLLLSTVTVLDEKRRSIPINTISSVPDLPRINMLEKLTDHKLVKDEKDIFTINYDFSIKEKFSLILAIDKSADPRYVRIWNPKLSDKELLSASVKNVSIYFAHKKVADGEVPQNFGIDIEFENENNEIDELKQCNSSLLIDELFPSYKQEERISDSYGIYPFGKSKKITIEVLSTYKSTDDIDCIGLNGVDFYNNKGNKLKISDIDFISVRNIYTSTYANPKNIVRHSMKTCCMDYQFLGNYQQECNDCNNQHKSSSPKSPMLIFTFKDPTSISMIRIWNFNSAEDKLENGIKKIVVRNNDRIIWSGKIRKGLGLIKGIERSATNIWLTDSISIREKISNQMIDEME